MESNDIPDMNHIKMIWPLKIIKEYITFSFSYYCMFLYYKKKYVSSLYIHIYIRNIHLESNFTINAWIVNRNGSFNDSLEYIDGAILKKNATNYAFIERQML